MGRAKLHMELIKKERSRNSTFHKRKSNLMKKAEELSTLCDVKIVMIILGPEGKYRQPLGPELIWPVNNRDEALGLINKYKQQTTEGRHKRTVGLSDLFEDRKRVAEIELAKLRKTNKYPTWETRFDGLHQNQLRQFSKFLKTRLGDAKAKLEMMRNCKKTNCHIVQQQQSLSLVERNNINFRDNNNSLVAVDPYESMDKSYNLVPMPLHQQQQQQQNVTNWDYYTNLIPNPMMVAVTNIDDIIGVRAFPNVVYDPTPHRVVEQLRPEPLRVEPPVVYNDPMMVGMVDSISYVNSLIMAPPVQPLPQYYVGYPMSAVGGVAPSTQMRAHSHHHQMNEHN